MPFSAEDSTPICMVFLHTGIATDLITLFKAFMVKMPQFKNTPFYIFSESYGGKMTAAFGVALYQEIQSGGIQCNFQGVALGDSWISPIDSVLTWAPYLYQMSLLDEKDLQEVIKVKVFNLLEFD